MLSNLTSLRTFSNGPLVRAELGNLRRQSATQRHWIRWFWRLFAVIAACLASISLWFDMPDSPRSMILFPLIALAVFIVHFNVAVKTLTLTSHSVAREATAENWDNLVLTGIDARKIVLAKWLAVLRCVWRDYLWAATLKLGLAFGLAKYFDNVFIGSCYRHLAGGLCYVNGYPYNAYRLVFYNDLLLPLLLFVSLLGVFALAEAGLLSALGICFGSLNRRHRIIGMGCAATFRGILVFAAVVAWVSLGDHSHRLYEQTTCCSPNQTTAFSRWNMTPWERQRLLGSAQILLSPLADSGTLIVTDLLRPSMPFDHLLRRLVTAAISLGLFGGLIWLSLRVAQMLAVWQRALRPREQERRLQELAT